jgi:peptidoglycan/LPS O-acetylase OafA/YrhL
MGNGLALETAMNPYLAHLTSIRGLMALWVIWYHMYPFNESLKTFTQFFNQGYLAVDFFFILSGFILCHVYGNKIAQLKTAAPYQQFMLARFARIYPLHIVVVGIYVVVELACLLLGKSAPGGLVPFTGNHSPVDLAATSLLVNAWGLTPHGLPDWNGASWSLSTEWFMYFLFPWLASVFFGAGLPLLLFSLIGLDALALLNINIGPAYHENTFGLFGLLRCFVAFTAGICLFRVAHKTLDLTWAKRDWPLLVITALLMVGLHVAAPVGAMLPLMAAMLYLLVQNEGRFAKVLSAKPLHYLGEISLSLYLLHGLFLGILQKSFGVISARLHLPDNVLTDVVTMAVFTVILVGISSLSYHWLEVPARQWIRRLTTAKKPALSA